MCRFWSDGRTLYTPEGGPSEAGRWRANAETGTYDSWWERSGWSSYAVEVEDGLHYWVDGRGRRQPFEVTGDA